MCYTGLFKRIIPFVLTFAGGLFLASFFVSIGLPGQGWRGAQRFDRANEFQRLRLENNDLREKLRDARLENEELRKSSQDMTIYGEIPMVPPVDFEMHHPPLPLSRRPDQPKLRIER